MIKMKNNIKISVIFTLFLSSNKKLFILKDNNVEIFHIILILMADEIISKISILVIIFQLENKLFKFINFLCHEL